jgi:hypothetical protein
VFLLEDAGLLKSSFWDSNDPLLGQGLTRKVEHVIDSWGKSKVLYGFVVVLSKWGLRIG